MLAGIPHNIFLQKKKLKHKLKLEKLLQQILGKPIKCIITLFKSEGVNVLKMQSGFFLRWIF